MDFLKRFLRKYFMVYLLVVSLFIGSAALMTRTVTAIAEALPIPRNTTIVIDPGMAVKMEAPLPAPASWKVS